jgi:hypothetical protein
MSDSPSLASEPPAPAAAPAPQPAPAVRAPLPPGRPDGWVQLLARSAPEARAAQIGSLQRTAGNRAVARLVTGTAPDPGLFAAFKDFGWDDLLSIFGFGPPPGAAAAPAAAAPAAPVAPAGPAPAAPAPAPAAPAPSANAAPEPAAPTSAPAETGTSANAATAPPAAGTAADSGAAAVTSLRTNPGFAAVLAKVEAVETSGVRLAETAK